MFGLISEDMDKKISSEISRLSKTLKDQKPVVDSAPQILSNRMDRDFSDISHRFRELESDLKSQMHSLKAENARRIEDIKSDTLSKFQSNMEDSIEQITITI